jgi:hypothetical protein
MLSSVCVFAGAFSRLVLVFRGHQNPLRDLVKGQDQGGGLEASTMGYPSNALFAVSKLLRSLSFLLFSFLL